MNADQPKPTLPTSPQPVGVPGMATEPIPDTHHGHDEPNALMKWLAGTWQKLKAGQLGGNPRWLALVVAVALVGGGWWYLSRASKRADSALWLNYDLAQTTEGLQKFVEEKSTGTTDAARIARVNLSRNKAGDGLRGLRAGRLADRQKGAKALEEARDELVKLADEFKDRTMKAQVLLDAADAEKALIGVPKEGVRVIPLEVKSGSRGQVERVAELTRKAAEAIGPDTDAGKKHAADAERYTRDAADIYTVSGYLHAAFNEPDPEEPKPVLPAPPSALTPPVGVIPGGDLPKAPDPIPAPVNPIKPDDKKPDDGPKAPPPLAPAAPDKK